MMAFVHYFRNTLFPILGGLHTYYIILEELIDEKYDFEKTLEKMIVV